VGKKVKKLKKNYTVYIRSTDNEIVCIINMIRQRKHRRLGNVLWHYVLLSRLTRRKNDWQV